MKVGPCPRESDRKYLMHAIGLTFGGLLWVEGSDFYRIKVWLDV